MTDKRTPIFDSLQARHADGERRARLEADLPITEEPRQPQTRRDLRDGLRNMKARKARKARPRYRRNGGLG
jgi:hypothetical protein